MKALKEQLDAVIDLTDEWTAVVERAAVPGMDPASYRAVLVATSRLVQERHKAEAHVLGLLADYVSERKPK